MLTFYFLTFFVTKQHSNMCVFPHLQEPRFGDENKPVLKLVMDPRGQIQDINSLRRQGYNIEPGSLSPEVAFDLVRDLNAPKGKGKISQFLPTFLG